MDKGHVAVATRSNDTINSVLFHEEPPPLNYTIITAHRKRAIIIWFSLLFVEAGILPLILFYSLHWGAHLSTTKNLAIITSLIGTVSGFKFAQRAWFLWFARDHVSRRPIGAGRWGVDFFQYVASDIHRIRRNMGRQLDICSGALKKRPREIVATDVPLHF